MHQPAFIQRAKHGLGPIRPGLLMLFVGIMFLLTACSSTNIAPVVVTGAPSTPAALPKWQLWTQDVSEDAALSPSLAVEHVRPNSEFDLIVALSGAALAKGVKSAEVSRNFRESILKATTDRVKIEVVAIPDARFLSFGSQQRNLATMWVDAKKFRELQAASRDSNEDQMTVALSSALLDETNVLGKTSFRFETLSSSGEGHIALSIWVNRRPVDQMTFRVCIGQDSQSCGKNRPISSSYGTLGAIASTAPDASLHLLPLGELAMVGVFFCATCGDDGEAAYLSWRTLNSEQQFVDVIEKQVMPAFTAATNLVSRTPDVGDFSAAYAAAGRLMHRLIFGLPSDPASKKAIDRFRDFILNAKHQERKPVLLTRFVADGLDKLILPVNIMTVAKQNPTEAVFTGFEVIVEHYSDSDSFSDDVCVRKITGIVPAANGSLNTARSASGFVLDKMAQVEKSVRVFTEAELPAFAQWLVDTKQEEGPVFLYFFGHHYEDRLCFDSDICEGENTIYPAAIEKVFPSNSVAFLNGCGTAAVGSTEALRSLSRLGVESFIATSTAVDTRMAGKFEGYFFDLLARHAKNSDYSISRARYDAALKLSDEVNPARNAKYGPAVLNYTFIGNGKSRTCIQATE